MTRKRDRDSREATYRDAARQVDRDDLHEAIARAGPGVLDEGLPYVLRAARWASASRQRTSARRRDLLERDAGHARESLHGSSVWDPYVRIRDREALRRVADALGALPDADALILWRSAEGASDEAILRELRDSTRAPDTASIAWLRKRRQRARERVRAVLGA